MKRLLIVLPVFAWMPFLSMLLHAEEPRLRSLRRIWDAAPHNAFTDLERFQDRWLCAFREGSGHAGSGDHGKIRVIASSDGVQWQSLALLDSPGLDLRDPKLSQLPDGSLLLNSCEYDVDHDSAEERANQSVTFVSGDGDQWEGPHRVADAGYWLWQTTWRDRTGYALGYRWGARDATRLYTTGDGQTYRSVIDSVRPPGDRANEHAMVFAPDGTAYLLLRRDHPAAGSGEALFGTAKPPYLDWTWRTLGVTIGGPAMILLPDGRLVAAVRRYPDAGRGESGSPWTELGFIEPESARYQPALRLPSGGDSSYAGLVWHDGLLWMSYYSSHEGKTAVYLATVELPAAPAEPYDESRLSASVLAQGLTRPLELDVAADGRVFFIELDGALKVYSPDTGAVTVAAQLDVFAEQENGLIGLALDPGFAGNQWIYLMYSPPGDVFVGQFVSRFVMQGDVLDRDSEKIVLRIPEHRDECCHHAGSLEFGPHGNLFIATGDNTHPAGDSAGYAPIDEREGRHAYDAQDTAGNTNDLRGKILRIRPLADGSYAIPEGNLFPAGGEIEGLPEIYVMGCRNPWRMNVDQRTGYVYWGEVGPDAGGESPRGPRGYDELNQARAAGNFGWPFFIADNKPYADHDFGTGETGALYDAEKPLNVSPTNTGSRLLPRPQPAWIYYPYAESAEFPMLGSGGRTACAGPVYHFDPALDSPTKLPQALDNCLFFFDWQRTFIKRVKLDADSGIISIDPFLTTIPVKRPVDMRIGPEGALYVLDYGETWGVNEDARLLRIDYFPGNRPPDARIASASGTVGRHPFRAVVSARESSDPDSGDSLRYSWSAAPGTVAAQTGEQAEFVFADPGAYVVTLEVRDEAGSMDTAKITFDVGNAPPVVQFASPADGGFFEWGDDVSFEVEVEDAEDGTSREAPELMRTRLLVNQFVQASAPGTAEAAYLSGAAAGPAGLALIQQGDCLNCHAVERRIVGPAFLEIAQRYAEVDDRQAAVQASAERIIAGSSKVWGEVPMLPHAQFTMEQAALMAQWVHGLADASGAAGVRQDFAGGMALRRPEWMGEVMGGTAVLRASYTDFGAEGVAPLSASAEVRLRSCRVEAEQFSRRDGTRTLSSPSAGSGRFIGDVSDGQSLLFDRVNLRGMRSVTARVASPATGGVVELRENSPGGKLIAALAFAATGDWEQWQEVSAEITDPGRLHDLCVVFVNRKGGGPFMNLDWLHFNR